METETPTVVAPRVYNISSKICICGCGTPLALGKGQIQYFVSGHRKKGRERGRHRRFLAAAYK